MRKGFTIVELLIVIVVIGILAAITIVAFNAVQDRARNSKIQSDIAQLEKAIMAARVNEGKPFYNITGTNYTATQCTGRANGTDLTNRTDSNVNGCWNRYEATLNIISNASGMNVRGIVDPWGRPYLIDENENENNDGRCTRDVIATFRNPHVSGAWDNEKRIANSLPTC